jgi:maleate cis-trans isomerase
MEENVTKRQLKPWPLGWKAKIGILIPAHDTGYGSYEFRCLCPDGVVTLETRVTGVKLTTEEMRKMGEDAIYAAKLVAQADPAVICFIGTAPCFVLGVEGEKALMKKMEKETGIPAAAGGDSVCRAFRALGTKKISLMVPTNEELTKTTVDYFRAQGFDVRDHLGLGQESIANINRMPPQELYGLVMKLYRRTPDVEGIFVTGGCFRILESVAQLEKDTGVPIVMTTAANIWRCMQIAGVKDPVTGFGRLLEMDR